MISIGRLEARDQLQKHPLPGGSTGSCPVPSDLSYLQLLLTWVAQSQWQRLMQLLAPAC